MGRRGVEAKRQRFASSQNYREGGRFMHRSSRLFFGIAMMGMAALFASDASARALFTYGLKGQTPQQEETDRAACHDWASAQSGYRPTGVPQTRRGATGAGRGAVTGLIIGGVIGAATGGLGLGVAIGAGSGGLIGGVVGRREQARLNAAYDAYLRAAQTCMEARGYQVSR
jgi:hypothetical protein